MVELTEHCFVSESGNGTCSAGEFKCESGAKCLPARWTCDGGKKFLWHCLSYNRTKCFAISSADHKNSSLHGFQSGTARTGVTRGRRSALSGSAGRRSGAARAPADTVCRWPGSATVSKSAKSDRQKVWSVAVNWRENLQRQVFWGVTELYPVGLVKGDLWV